MEEGRWNELALCTNGVESENEKRREGDEMN